LVGAAGRPAAWLWHILFSTILKLLPGIKLWLKSTMFLHVSDFFESPLLISHLIMLSSWGIELLLPFLSWYLLNALSASGSINFRFETVLLLKGSLSLVQNILYLSCHWWFAFRYCLFDIVRYGGAI